MISTEPSGESLPYVYLNPAYWNGHSIGVGEAEPLPFVPPVGETAVKNRLQKKIQAIDKPLPLETLRGDDMFDPEAYTPGTVVFMREEALNGRPDSSPVQPGQFQEESIPEHPTATSPYFGNDVEQTHVNFGDITYSSMARWGIVAPRGRKGQTLHTVPTTIVKKEDDQVIVAGLPIPRKGPIEIGQTKHYRSKTGAERLVRVNIMEVMAYGQQNRKSPVAPDTARLLAEQGS